MFNRELPKLWSDAIIAGDATILSVPVNLLHLLTIQESGEFRRRGRQEGEPGPSTPVTPMPQIIMIPALPVPSPGSSVVPPQEGSLALLPRKILPICTATLPGSSSASPYSWTLLGNASSSSTRKRTPSAPSSASQRPGLLGTGCQQA